MIDKVYFPASIRYGIPYETFWHLNPRILKIYQDEHNRKMQEQAELIDYTAWQNGKYIINAVQSALFPRKAKYPQKPYSQQEQIEELSGEEEFVLWVAEFNMQHPELPEA